jgi:hypothetical protein
MIGDERNDLHPPFYKGGNLVRGKSTSVPIAGIRKMLQSYSTLLQQSGLDLLTLPEKMIIFTFLIIDVLIHLTRPNTGHPTNYIK